MGQNEEGSKGSMRTRLVKRFMRQFRRGDEDSPFDKPSTSDRVSADTVTTSSNPSEQTGAFLRPSPVQIAQKASQKELWARAADSLDAEDRDELQKLFRSNRKSPEGYARGSLADNVKSTLARAEKLKETGKEATWRSVVDKIIKGALAFKSLGDAAVEFDKSGYAALGWSVVSLGLQIAANAEATREFVLSSSEVISRFMVKYQHYERAFRGPDIGAEFDRLLTNAYKAIILYMIALDRYLRQNGAGRAAHAINKLEDQSINSNKKAVDAADAEVRDWLLIIMHMRNDNNFSQIRRMLQGYDLPEVPEVAQECLKSLSFEEMEDRFHDIERATEGTCKWLLRHEKYRDWTDADRGVLCIKGKPGSGKSTLLHYAVGDAVVASNVPDGLPIQRNEPLPGSREAPADKTESNVLILSFFFHDRGTNLQKTPLGLFRSLLHQVLRCVPDAIPNALLTTFEDRNKKVGEVGKQWHWNWREIRDYFRLSLRNVLESHRVCLFIDALDEYGEEEANELLQSLDFWIQELPSQAQFRICFTCRHYPPLVLPQGTVEIRLEEENEDDISTYVQVQLSSWSKDENLAAIWTEIADRAEGVFVWARLIVPRVLSLERRGENWRKIKREIENTPRALEDLYRSLVQKVETNPDSLKLIRWICFAIEPLTLDELRWAMIVDPDYSDEPASLRHYENLEDFATDCDMMEKKLKALSCGLAEAVPSSRVVQFIHQSVKDFFITEGLWVLQKYQDPAMKKTNEVDLKTTAHSQLSKTCIRYFSAEEFTHSGLDLYSDELTDSFPLLRYAATNWVAHVHQSEKDARQTDLLQYLGWPSDDIAQLWMKLPKGPRESLDVVRQRGLGTILHIASGYQLMGLLRAILQNKELLDNRIDATDSDSPTPLFVAAGEGHYDVVRLLLENGADPNFYCGELGHALGAAAERGDERVIRLLLDYGADANAEARLGQSALQVAALYRHYRAVKILLDNGADADARGGNLGTALQTAPMDPGDEQIALLLVDSGADVNAVGQLPSTPLAKASLAGNEKLVGILIQNGADVNGGKYGSPLKAASMRGHQHIVRMLLENGADVNAPCDKHDGTALEMASSNGDGLLVQILLENGADVNAGENSNPLGAASMRGHQQVVRMLLENGADVNAPCDEDNKTALERALWAGHEQVVQILIEYGAERPSPVL